MRLLVPLGGEEKADLCRLESVCHGTDHEKGKSPEYEQFKHSNDSTSNF